MANNKLDAGTARKELGASGAHISAGFKQDEFLPQLRGSRAIRKYREMIDNDATIGALLLSMEMMLRAVEWRVEPADDSPEADREAQFVEEVMDDMSHTFESFISQSVSFLKYGFSFFEVVYKTRQGPMQRDGARRSKYKDGRIGIRKLAPRPQSTLEEFEIDENGGVAAFVQSGFGVAGNVRIPIEKGLLFNTTTDNASPYGRSVIRNAYKSYYYLTNIQNIEAIAIEREMNGFPVGYIPSEYLAADATADQLAFRNKFEEILRDMKLNEQGYAVFPSDPCLDGEGKPTGEKLVQVELMASNGTRAVDMNQVITRYQADMARSVLADFLTLGQSDRGSFALSKSKADLFLRSLEGYLRNIASVLNTHLLPKLWELNGLNPDLMPTMQHGNVSPPNLEELGNYIRNLMAVGAVGPDEDMGNVLLEAAGLPQQEQDPDLLGREAGDAADSEA